MNKEIEKWRRKFQIIKTLIKDEGLKTWFTYYCAKCGDPVRLNLNWKIFPDCVEISEGTPKKHEKKD